MKVYIRIRQSSCITRTSPSDLVSFQDICGWKEVLPLCRDAVGVFYNPSRLGKILTDTNSPIQIRSGYNKNNRIQFNVILRIFFLYWYNIISLWVIKLAYANPADRVNE